MNFRSDYTHTQVHRVALRFGGLSNLATAIGRSYNRVQRWRMPKTHGGTDGLIPSSVVPDVISAAELMGIELTPADWDPRPADPNRITPLGDDS